MSDYYAILFVQFVLVAVTLIAVYKSLRRYWSKSGVAVEVLRGPESRRRFTVWFGFMSVLAMQLIDVSQAFEGHKVLLGIVDLGMLFYLCFMNTWFRNRIILWSSSWEHRPER